MSNRTPNQTTGGIGHVLLDALEDCFTVTAAIEDKKPVAYVQFDRERAADLIDDYAGRIAVGRL